MVYKFWYAMQLGDTQECVDAMVRGALPVISHYLIDSSVDDEDIYYAHLHGIDMDIVGVLGYIFSDDMVLFGADMEDIAPKETLRALGLL